MNIMREIFGKTSNGSVIDAFILSNRSGMKAKILDYGGVVNQIWTPDRQGRVQDIVLGYDTVDGVLHDTFYLGAIIGRYANRIARGRFTLDGKVYDLAKNNNGNHLHGGLRGFDKVLYRSAINGSTLDLTYLSKDGEEGYPGNLTLTVSYSLSETNELSITYQAVTDRRTVVNLTNHMYFNLAADFAADILQHRLTLHAGGFTPTDAGLIPTGEIASVLGTPLDFTHSAVIGHRIDADYLPLQLGRGYDHNYVLDSPDSTLKLAALVHEPSSGRILEVLTTEPAVQFYSGNFLDGSANGKGGLAINSRTGFCLEPQHFPDSPNHPNFPSTILDPGKPLISQTVYRFSTA